MSSVDSKPEQEIVIQEESPLVQELRAEIASLKRDKERSEALWLTVASYLEPDTVHHAGIAAAAPASCR